MTLSAGTRIGPYVVRDSIGEGGMGQVYRAHDARLNRDVALKVLPDLFASDPERLARFHREAQMLAALNHANIAHIHGVEDQQGIHALVMELVPGPTLADRLAHGPIPFDEALAIAAQIGEALESAHGQGIIHRDLKPANIKVREDGAVKVLDFGLAKLANPDVSGAGGSGSGHAATVTTPAMTMAGVILGTAAYMSPEQTKGGPVDKRSDIWAFGAVLYEMVSGRRAFDGEDVTDTLANVLKSEPDWSALPPDLPPHIARLIKRCLAKDRRQRLADIAVALFVIAEDQPAVAASSLPVAPPPPRASLLRRTLLPIAAATIVGALSALAVWLATRPEPGAVTRFAIPQTGPRALAIDAQSRDLTITPDGNRIVYKGGLTTTTSQLFVRALDQLEPTSLMLTGLPRAPFSSPDGQWIGFIEPAPATLKKVAITGGPATTICALDNPSRGATWGADDQIIFATTTMETGLQRVPAKGGNPTVLTRPNRDRGESDHLYPHLLPGGQAVLFTITALGGTMDTAQIAVLDLRNPAATPRILVRGGSQAQYAASGHLVYVAGGGLRAIAFDLSRLETMGNSMPVVPNVTVLPTGTAEFDLSRDGTLIYLTGASSSNDRTLVWVDRQGRIEPVKAAPARPYMSPRLSPDGTRVAVNIIDQDNDVWVWHLAVETMTRVTFDPGLDQAPVWLSDTSLAFTSQIGGTGGSVVRQSADGTGKAERLVTGPNVSRPSSVTPDGTRLLFGEAATATAADLKMLPLANPAAVEVLLQTSFIERNAEVSPDGRWMAYDSNDSTEYQVSVRPFPDTQSQRWHVSTAGGSQPVWSRSGDELFYVTPDGAIMSVRVGRGPTWSAGAPTRVVPPRSIRFGTVSTARAYDVSPDGKRFLVIKEAASLADAPPVDVVVVRNWLEELKRLVPPPR